ncbi:MAG: hypothetical protein AAF550_09490 [Myxococcota bacterium]
MSVLLVSGCIESSQTQVEFELELVGTERTGTFEVRDGWRVELQQADVVFGPLYLCAGTQAGDFCDSALVEFLQSTTVNALAPTPIPAGRMRGISGVTRSYMYDLGYVSLLTRSEPLVTPAAEELEGSVVLLGEASRDGIRFPFQAELEIYVEDETERGIPIVRSSLGDLAPHLISNDDILSVRFDPSSWLSTSNFGTLLEESTCEGGHTIGCSGNLASVCETSPIEIVDCSPVGFCQTDLGCTDIATIRADSQMGRAIRNDLVAGVRPRFEWRIRD